MINETRVRIRILTIVFPGRSQDDAARPALKVAKIYSESRGRVGGGAGGLRVKGK